MRTTKNVVGKVHNCTHFKWWLTQFDWKCNILEIFHYFQYFECVCSMKNGKFQSSKSSTGFLISEKSLIPRQRALSLPSKSVFKTMGNLKEKFWDGKKTRSTFLKIWLSKLSGPMLKTQKNAIRNQFEQQWFNVISVQKPRRVYTAIWYKLKPFAIKKGRFKL